MVKEYAKIAEILRALLRTLLCDLSGDGLVFAAPKDVANSIK
jgi:hypothetical protein